MSEKTLSRAQLYELSENHGRNSSENPTMGEIIATSFNRRDLLTGALAVTAINTAIGGLALGGALIAFRRTHISPGPSGDDPKILFRAAARGADRPIARTRTLELRTLEL